jgi:adenylylsulfate kinase
MGLPGSGKTTLSKELVQLLQCSYLNADIVRKQYNDWDFSVDGRLRQAHRMRELSNQGDWVCDFVCPLQETREIIQADFTIWMDTIKVCRFDDTTQLFVPPDKYDIRIQHHGKL